jgi:type II secretory pathway component GspD/PulD (secretin)
MIASDRVSTSLKMIATAAILAAVGAFVALPSSAAVKPGSTFDGEKLTLEAENATLSEILETVARTAGVDVLVARGFKDGNDRLSFQFQGQPIEEVLRRLLRGLNYAAIYTKEEDGFRIAALKIFFDGQQGAEMVPLFSGGRTAIYEEKSRRGETVTVMVSSGGEVITQGGLQKKGLLVPSQTVPNPANSSEATLNKPWFSMQSRLESEEAAQYQDLMLLQKRLESATDPELKKSLAMIYADEVARFHTTKRANTSKIESLKRIDQLGEMTGQ